MVHVEEFSWRLLLHIYLVIFVHRLDSNKLYCCTCNAGVSVFHKWKLICGKMLHEAGEFLDKTKFKFRLSEHEKMEKNKMKSSSFKHTSILNQYHLDNYWFQLSFKNYDLPMGLDGWGCYTPTTTFGFLAENYLPSNTGLNLGKAKKCYSLKKGKQSLIKTSFLSHRPSATKHFVLADANYLQRSTNDPLFPTHFGQKFTPASPINYGWIIAATE